MKKRIKNWLKNNWKQVFFAVLFTIIIGSFFLISHNAVADVWVNGYYRSNGTYVSGHYRSSPDGDPYNNWSFPGNTNPYTGETAGGSASTYLENYYGNDSYTPSYDSYTPSYNSYYSTPDCPLYSTYNSSSDSCECNYGYVVSGSKCVYGSTYCHNKHGYNSNYSSASNACKCDYGYVFDSSDKCVNRDNYCQNLYGYNAKYDILDSKCVCKTGYVVNDSNKCTNGDSYCRNKYSYYSSYNSLDKSCECDSGYILKSGKCAKEEDDSAEYFKASAYSSAFESNSETNSNQQEYDKPDISSIPDGALIRVRNNVDIYIVKYIGLKRFKRLILSPSVFNNYGHLRWEDVIEVNQSEFDSFTTSNLIRSVNDHKIYVLYPSGDTGEKRLIKDYNVLTRLGYDTDSIYEINQFDRDSYIIGNVIE